MSRTAGWVAVAVTAVLAYPAGAGQGGEPPLSGMRVAVTVDDLPANGALLPGTSRAAIARGVSAALLRNRVPRAFAFANGQDIAADPGLREVLREWAAAGYPVANHGFSHADLNALTADAYVADIEKMDRLLESTLPAAPRAERRVYRYPFLNEGDTLAKRNAVRQYLFSEGYRIAQVTVDYYDWAWNAAYHRCRVQQDGPAIEWLTAHVVESATGSMRAAKAMAARLFGRDIPHVLLVHVGAFDAVTLDAVLQNLRRQGVTFVPLDEALADPAYALNPDHASSIGLTFLEQVAAARVVDISDLQETPYTLERLNGICAAA